MPKNLRPAVDLMAFKCRTLKVKARILIFWDRVRSAKGNCLLPYFTPLRRVALCLHGLVGPYDYE
jgi:hypothetical protein